LTEAIQLEPERIMVWVIATLSAWKDLQTKQAYTRHASSNVCKVDNKIGENHDSMHRMMMANEAYLAASGG